MDDMAIRKIKDAKDLNDDSLIYFKSHAKATYMSDGSTVEDAIKNIETNSNNIDLSDYETKVESQNKLLEAKNYTDTKTLVFTTELIDVKSELSKKQSTLISGTNIKTINGQSLLGEGNIVISGGSNSSGGTYSLVEHDINDTTCTLTPNTFHVWGEVNSLTLTFGEEQSGVANEFLFQFESGETATTLTLPYNLIWANDDIPIIESNYTYQVSILKGFATLMKFKKAVLYEFTITIYEGYGMNTRHETYSYKTGMTWRQWVNSEYNTNGNYKINNDGYIYNDIANVMSGVVYYSTSMGPVEITESDLIDNTINYCIE